MTVLAAALLTLVAYLAVTTTPTVAGCALLVAGGFWCGVGVGRNFTVRRNGIDMIRTGKHRALSGRW